MSCRISIIIVTYNGKKYLHECLSSVMAQQYSDFEVIVIDNGSTDGSADYIKKTFPAIRLIECERNLGFAGGNNLGVHHSNGRLIVLLNNDTVVRPGWLHGLVKAVEDERVACASSLIKTEGIPERYYEKNGSVNFLGHNIMRIFNDPADIFFAGGASMIFKKDIIGIPFDEDYFVYAEDVYLSLRFRFKGYSVRHTNDSVVDHAGSGTARHQKNEFLTFYQERNRILNTLLFFSPMTILKVLPLFAVNCLAKSFVSLAGKKYSFVGLVRAYSWILFHIPTIREKRAVLRSERRAEESEVIRCMTGKLTNGESPFGKAANMVSIAYCRLVRLGTIELTA